jgi:hypothetical protein
MFLNLTYGQNDEGIGVDGDLQLRPPLIGEE